MAFEGLSERLSGVFKTLRNRGKLNENDIKTAMREVRVALLEADVNFKIAKKFVASVSEKAVGEEVMQSLTPAQQVVKIVNEELTALMGTEVTPLRLNSKPPTIILMCGLQGSGKTTHSGKLALHLKSKGHRPLLVACDIYRPAAIDQLKVVGEKADVKVFEMGKTDPRVIAKSAVAHAKDYGNDVVILDTAGRLHVDEELMAELHDIKNSVSPDYTMLVVDSMTGQDAVNVAKSFDDLLDISGVIITKLDGDTRGGAALSVKEVTGKPIMFAGVGEKLEDLEPFYPDRMASRILGMGDVLTLIDKAQSQIDEVQAEKMAEKLQKGKFDLEDMVEQLRQMKKMGGLESIMGMLPGANIPKDASIDEKQLDRVEAIIMSMTKKERENPKIINPSRKRRIAAGSGTEVQDVNRLLRQFEQSQKMMKMMKGKKGRRNPLLRGF